MKKQSIKAISKKAFTFLFVAIFSAAIMQNAYALPDRPVNKTAAEITYAGLVENKLAFNVNYKNELAQPFQLIIKNEQDQVIYSKQFDPKPLNKTLLFSDFIDNQKLTFSIKTGKKEFDQSFQIKSNVKTVEEFTVKGI